MHFFPVAGHSCYLDQLGAPRLLQSIRLAFEYRSLLVFNFFCPHVGFSFLPLFPWIHLVFRTSIHVLRL